MVTDEYEFAHGSGPTKGEALAEYKYLLACIFRGETQARAQGIGPLPELDHLQQFVRRY